MAVPDVDEQFLVAALELAIKQRHPELLGLLFRSKPELLPQADWDRILEETGVTKFRENELPQLCVKALGQ